MGLTNVNAEKLWVYDKKYLLFQNVFSKMTGFWFYFTVR